MFQNFEIRGKIEIERKHYDAQQLDEGDQSSVCSQNEDKLQEKPMRQAPKNRNQGNNYKKFSTMGWCMQSVRSTGLLFVESDQVEEEAQEAALHT